MTSEMELVNLFNSELSSLYDVKPPISKGKMTSITKAALKAVKLYKHVVQSVEKFIQKCKAEYKIPGLYVIDSIIRQSRHQYGVEKDIFTTRFSRNLQATFVHIYRCPDEDKSKVIRVLNLWQKNKIFAPEAIAPLFDLADPNNAIWETVGTLVDSSAGGGGNSAGNGQASNNNTASSFYNEIQFKSHLLDYDYDEDPDDGEKPVTNSATSSNNLQVPPPPVIRAEPSNSSQLANSLAGMDALGTILSNPEVLRQLQTLQEQMTAAAQAQHQQQQNEYLTPEQERQRKLAELNKQEAAFDQRLAQTVAKTHFAVECGDFIEDQENKAKSPEGTFSGGPTDQNSNQLSHGVLAPPPFFQQMAADQGRVSANPFGLPLNFPLIASQFAQQQQSEQMALYTSQLHGESGMFQNFHPSQQYDPAIQGGNITDDDIIEIRNHRNDRSDRDRIRSDRRRRRSRSRDKTRRSRSNEMSPSRLGRSRRSRSSSRNHSSSRSGKRRDRSRERREEKERQRKGFGAIRRDHLSVCSTTLWVGHLSKLVSQEELSDTFGQYGDVVSIDLIQSRGCAFVVMNRRQDAVRALDRLRKGTKLQGKEITLAWAPGKGVKGRDWKDYWEVDCGISYIPWSKLTTETDLEEFEDGGCSDESTLPDFLKNRPKKEKLESSEEKKLESTPILTDLTVESNAAGLATKEGTGSNGMNDVDSRAELATNHLQPIPTPVPPVMANAAAFGMPPSVGMMGVPPMALNMMIPPPLIGGPMGMPQFQLMGMMGAGPLGMNPDSSASQMKPPSGGVGLLGDGPVPQLDNSSNLQLSSVNQLIDEHSADEERKRTNPERGERERKRSRFNNPDEKYSPTRDMESRNEPPLQLQEQRSGSDEKLFDRLKSMAGGYSMNNTGGNPDGMNMANSLLGQPMIGPPLLGPRGPNNFRGGGFRPPFMNERGGIRGPWFDGGPPSQNPFMNPPSQNPFIAAGGNPFISNNENPFEDRRGPNDHGDRGEFFGGPNDRFHNKRGGWREGPPGPWRGRGGPPLRGGRGGRWRQPKPNHNFIANNNS